MSTILAAQKVSCPHCGKVNRLPAAAAGAPKCGNCHRPVPWIVEATDDTFAEVAEGSDLFVLIDMWASWCGPCRMVSPALEQLASELAGQLKLVKVDVDASQALSRRFEIQSIPTLIVMHHGQVLSRRSGAAPVQALRDWVQGVIRKYQQEAS
jgi:thioredoxin 2